MRSLAAMLLTSVIAVWAAVGFGQITHITHQGGPKGGPALTGRHAHRPRELPLDTEAPISPRRQFDLHRMRRDASELAALAQDIPPAVDRLSENVLPSNLPERLKRIEKLAKQLRRDIAP